MPRQIFDVEQYELRGTLPQTYTESQKNTLNKVVSRVNGQLDWTAQLLGFNGPRYWGSPSVDAEGNYQFVGLPQTVSEKRALQTGAFGIYNKDKPYESWPAPFNRKAVGASADFTFSIEDRDGQVAVWPFGQDRNFTFEKSPFLVIGGAYTFDQLVDVSVFGADPESVEVIQDIDQRVTRVRILDDAIQFIAVYLEGSDAKPFTFSTRNWVDPSDWEDDQVREQFLGAWGSKGNQLSMHFAFDALDLHGFNEVEALSLDKITGSLTISDLLGLIGLKPGPMSALVSAPYSFEVEGCEVSGPFSPSVEFESTSATLQTNDFLDITSEDGRLIASDEGSCGVQDYIFMLTDGDDGTGGGSEFDNGFFPDEGNVACFSDNGTFELPGSVTGELNNGVYELTGDFPIEANGIYDQNPLSICQNDPDTTPTGLLSNGEYPGDYFPNPAGTVDNDGTYDISIEQLMTEDLKLISANNESFDYSGCYAEPAEAYGVCDTCDYTLTLRQTYDSDPNGLATDPGPETSIPIGLNGFMRDAEIDCGIDNGGFEDNILTNFYLDRARTVLWEDIVPVNSFTVETRDSGTFTIQELGGFFEFLARNQFVAIPPPANSFNGGLIDDGSYGDLNPNALTKFDLNLPDQDITGGIRDYGDLSPAVGTTAWDFGVVYQVPFDGVVDQQIGEYAIYDGIYDQDPALNCDTPQAPEIDINYFDLVVDIFGEPGPILISDSGVGNEIVLTAADDDEFGYDGLTIAFDGLELAQLAFDYEAKTPFAMTEFPSVEWVVDLQLDNGTFYPVSDQGAWMGTDDGDFEDRMEFVRVGTIASIFDSEQEAIGLEFKGGLLTFDDGEFDELVEPNCDFEGGSPCALVDGGVFVEGLDATVANTNCFEECGKIDSGDYKFFGYVPPATPVIDGQGSRTIPDSCTLYDNSTYDRAPRPDASGEGYFSCTTYDNSVYPFTGIYDCNLEEWGEFGLSPAGPRVDQGEYTDSSFPESCAPCGPVEPGFDCYINNGTLENFAPGALADEGFYDNAFEICEPCVVEVESTVPCYVPPVRIRLDRAIYANPLWKFNPSVVNAETPLRVWKNHVLSVVDDRSDEITNENVGDFLESKAYHNSFVADHNTGPERENSYRYFVRLPAEYSRNSRQWNKATNIVSSYGYFSSVYPLADTAVRPYDIRPYLYDDVYCQCAEDLPDYAVFYQEDYLVSSVKTARIDAQAGFQESNISFENAAEVFPFAAGLIVNYDPFDEREIRNQDGEWAGTYFKWQRRGPLTGYLITDVLDSKLRAVERGEEPEGDYSFIKAPNTEFPDDTDVANFANYTVAYAYFTADLSAADEPVFDPTVKYSWRECNIPKCDDGTPVFETDITGIEILTEDGFNLGLGGAPVYVESAVESNTAYLLNRCEKFVAPQIDIEQFLDNPTPAPRKRSGTPPAAPGTPTITFDPPGGSGTLSGAVKLTGTLTNASSVEVQIGLFVRSATVNTDGTWEYAMTPADFAEFVRVATPSGQFVLQATALSDTPGLTATARVNALLALPTNRNRTLVAVIDENQGAVGWSNNPTYHGPLPDVETAWQQFRDKWPDRSFYLLEPYGGWGGFSTEMPDGTESRIKIPDQFIDEVVEGTKTFYTHVNRDYGQAKDASDWYTLINGDALPEGAEIALFVDNSGSLTTAQVQASYDLFLEKLAERNIGIIVVENRNEDWIGPFMGDLFGDEEPVD